MKLLRFQGELPTPVEVVGTAVLVIVTVPFTIYMNSAPYSEMLDALALVFVPLLLWCADQVLVCLVKCLLLSSKLVAIASARAISLLGFLLNAMVLPSFLIFTAMSYGASPLNTATHFKYTLVAVCAAYSYRLGKLAAPRAVGFLIGRPPALLNRG